MKNKLIATSTVLGVVLTVGVALAVPNTPGTTKASLKIPAHVVEISPGVFSLGTAIDPATGKVVEGRLAFHHRPGHGGGPGGGGPGGGDSDTSSCNGVFAKDAKWKVVDEAWEVNPDNLDGMSSSFVFDTLTAGIDKWEDAAVADILGDGSTTGSVLEADFVSPDDVNEVYFADISEPGVVGVTVVWGIFNGPPFARELVEWDQVYDDVDYDWGDAELDETLMDFDNVVTHELGHSVGLIDLYTAECSEMTMYGFVSEGETNARSLEDGDIEGVNKLY